jgi:transposase-like protein
MQETQTVARSSSRYFFAPFDVREEFTAKFLDENFCREWILRRLHPQGATCPHCELTIHEQRFWLARKIKCSQCKKWFTALTGTFLSGCQFTFSEVIVLAMFLSLQVPDKEIAKVLDISSENVRLWRHKFMANQKIEQLIDR